MESSLMTDGEKQILQEIEAVRSKARKFCPPRRRDMLRLSRLYRALDRRYYAQVADLDSGDNGIR